MIPFRLVVSVGYILVLTALASLANGQGVSRSATWKDNAQNEEGYRFYGSIDKGVTWEKLADGPANSVGVQFQVPDNRARCYSATAFNSAGESGKTNMVCEGAPRAPEDLKVE